FSHHHNRIYDLLFGTVDDDVSAHLLRQVQSVFDNVDSEDLAGSERFAKPNQACSYRTATKDCDRVYRYVCGRSSVNGVTQRFLRASPLNGNPLVVEPRATFVKGMILSEAPVGVDSPKEHPFADVTVTGATLKASSTVNVSLARDNI